MAEDAVDEAIRAFKLKPKKVTHVPDISGLNVFNDAAILDGTCQTHRVRLIGAHGYSKTLFINLVQHFGIDADVATHLAQSYGDRAWDVAALASPATNTAHFPVRGQRLTPLHPFIDGEVRYAVQSEYAQTAVDVLARRTRLSFLNAQAALEALPMVIDLMSEELQWNQARKDLEWTETVQFLASMGLPASKLSLTREDVLQGKAAAPIDDPSVNNGQSFLPLTLLVPLTLTDFTSTSHDNPPTIGIGQSPGITLGSPVNSYP